MYALLFLIAVVSAGKEYVPLASYGKTTCIDSTPRKDVYAGRYVGGTKGGQTFPSNRQVNSEQACADLCYAEQDCAEFTWYNGPCYLFLTKSTLCNTFSGGGSGYFNAIFTPIAENDYRTCSDSTCRKDLYAGTWVNCAGPAFTAKSVPNAKACAAECVATSGCKYFTFYSFGPCNLFVTGTGTCVEGKSGAQGSWYRFGASNLPSPLESEEAIGEEDPDRRNHEDPNVAARDHEDPNVAARDSEDPNVAARDHEDPDAKKDYLDTERSVKTHEGEMSIITGLSVGLGVAGFLVLALSAVVITILVKSGQKASDDYSAQLL